MVYLKLEWSFNTNWMLLRAKLRLHKIWQTLPESKQASLVFSLANNSTMNVFFDLKLGKFTSMFNNAYANVISLF